MVTIDLSKRKSILKIGLVEIGKRYEPGYKCEDFVRDIYRKTEVSIYFNDHPILSFEDILKEEFIGYLCFLKHKKYVQELYRFTHVGIIFPDHHLLHYSRYFGEPNVRKVYLTPFPRIFEVYNFI